MQSVSFERVDTSGNCAREKKKPPPWAKPYCVLPALNPSNSEREISVLLMMHSLICTQVPFPCLDHSVFPFDPVQVSPQRLRFLVVGGRSFRPPNRTRTAPFRQYAFFRCQGLKCCRKRRRPFPARNSDFNKVLIDMIRPKKLLTRKY